MKYKDSKKLFRKLKKSKKDNIKRVVDRDIEIARKIIKNVEQFEFPWKH